MASGLNDKRFTLYLAHRIAQHLVSINTICCCDNFKDFFFFQINTANKEFNKDNLHICYGKTRKHPGAPNKLPRDMENILAMSKVLLTHKNLRYFVPQVPITGKMLNGYPCFQ